MTETFNGCTFTDLWASPANWKTTTSLKGDWYVQCVFYDPAFKDRYPRGFQYRKRLNKLKTLEERKAAIKMYFEEMPSILKDSGYNPISGLYMIDQPVEMAIETPDGDLHPDLLIFKALRLAQTKISGSDQHKYQVLAALNRTEKHAIKIHKYHIRAIDFSFGQLNDILDSMNLTPGYFNKFRSYFMSLFKVLKKYKCCTENFAKDLDTKTVISKPREVLEPYELEMILDRLAVTHPDFHRYLRIFFYSGTRNTELFTVQTQHVRLEKQEYDVIVYKGNQPKWETKPIIKSAVRYWRDLMQFAKRDDFIFSKSLAPGRAHIRSRQITIRWRRHVKNHLAFYNGQLHTIDDLESKGITTYRRIVADVYSLKHNFLDLIDAQQNGSGFVDKELLQVISTLDADDQTKALLLSKLGGSLGFDAAQRMAAHATPTITNKVYKTNKLKREIELLKNISI